MKTRNPLLLTIQGPDRPGITARLCQTVAKYELPIIDIEQASTHRVLSLSLLLDCSGSPKLDDFYLELAQIKNQFDLKIEWNLISPSDMISFQELTERVNQNLFAITVIGQEVGAAALAQLTAAIALHQGNITNIHKLSRRHLDAIEMIVT